MSSVFGTGFGSGEAVAGGTIATLGCAAGTGGEADGVVAAAGAFKVGALPVCAGAANGFATDAVGAVEAFATAGALPAGDGETGETGPGAAVAAWAGGWG
jgi:hypothetical protein